MTEKKASNITEAGRRAMAQSGRRNLEEWRAREGVATPELQVKVAAWAVDLIAEIGPPLTASQRALLDTAKLSYLVISLAFSQLSLGRIAPARLAALSETIRQHQNMLLRTLKQLGVSKRRVPAPESTLADIIAEYDEGSDGRG